jgi:hypothetical protein
MCRNAADVDAQKKKSGGGRGDEEDNEIGIRCGGEMRNEKMKTIEDVMSCVPL